MKHIIYIIIILLLGLFLYNSFTSEPEQVIQYREGEIDTVVVKDTIYSKETLYRIKTKVDTVFVSIDSSGILRYDSIRTAWSNYKIEVDTLVGVLGKVRLNGSMFEFDSTSIYYPKYYMTKVDTIKLPVIKKVSKEFYEDEWFYATILAILSRLL